MKEIQILDCTLRDGGRVIDCNFGEETIQNIVNNLLAAGIDIIELGFIRDKINYKEGSTFFTDIKQVKRYVTKQANVKLVLFVDYGMFDVDVLPAVDDDNPIAGIRFGFKKGELAQAYDEILKIKQKGYLLFFQDVDTCGYSKEELIDLIKVVNQIKPYSFGIVDTYGTMYQDELMELFQLVHHNLDPEIALDFHSHNNYQLSFSLAQAMADAAVGKSRKIIIDATLYGMGKVAGNLNTELLVDYLNRKHNGKYDLSVIFDVIDESIMQYYDKPNWGYSTNALLSGKYKAHPNNVIYLTGKYKLDTNDVENILKLIDDTKRKTYDYDNIEECYIAYNSAKKGRSEKVKELCEVIRNRTVLVIAPGASIDQYRNKIDSFIKSRAPVIISINFEYLTEHPSYAFFASQKRYKKYVRRNEHTRVVLATSVKARGQNEIEIDYHKFVKRGWDNFDNATIMMLRFLADTDVAAIEIAGFDGFSPNDANFTRGTGFLGRVDLDFSKINREILTMFWEIAVELKAKRIPVHFLTPSMYDLNRNVEVNDSL